MAYNVNLQQVVFSDLDRVTLESTQAQFDLGRDDVLLRNQFTLVSAGTELAKLTGLEQVNYPFIPGNRAIGRVVAVGADVTDLKVGDLAFSHAPHVSHAAAGAFRVPAPRGVNPRQAALVGLALVGMTAVRVGQVELGDRAAVIGMGLVGNLAAQLLQLAGAEVIAIDLNAARLAAARACGLSITIDAARDDVHDALMAITQDRGVDVVVEASGAAQAAELAVSLTGRAGEGIVVLLGSPRKGHETDLTPFLNRVHLWRGGSVMLRGAHEWRYPRNHGPYQKHSMARNAETVFRLMLQDKLCTAPLLTHVYRPAAAPEAYAGLQQDPDTHLGVLFDWTGEQ